MAKGKSTKRESAKPAPEQTRARVTCWLGAQALHKLELAVVDLKMQTGRREVEYGDVLETMLLEKYSSLTLVHRSRPAAEPEPPAEAKPAEPELPPSQPENP